MITKQRFSDIKDGDIVILEGGYPRMAVGDARGLYITFKKVRGYGMTTYLYWDLYKRIKGIVKRKEE